MTSQQPTLMSVVPLIAVAALVVFRNSRPRKIAVAQLWIMPIILVALTGFLVWATVMEDPAMLGMSAIAGVIGIVAGFPLGYARGHHSQVELGERPGTMVLHPSMIVMMIWLAAFVVRTGIKLVIPQAGPQVLALSNGFLLFALSSLVTANVMIFKKYEGLRAAQ